MILKLSPLDSPDVGEPEKYPQHMPEVQYLQNDLEAQEFF